MTPGIEASLLRSPTLIPLRCSSSCQTRRCIGVAGVVHVWPLSGSYWFVYRVLSIDTLLFCQKVDWIVRWTLFSWVTSPHKWLGTGKVWKPRVVCEVLLGMPVQCSGHLQCVALWCSFSRVEAAGLKTGWHQPRFSGSVWQWWRREFVGFMTVHALVFRHACSAASYHMKGVLLKCLNVDELLKRNFVVLSTYKCVFL